MARRKKAEGGGATSEWLNTYADMVTLLLTFFILLYSMSSLDAAKFDIFVKATNNQIETPDKIVIRGDDEGDAQGGVPPVASEEVLSPEDAPDMQDVLDALEEYISANNLEDKVQVTEVDGAVFIRFMDDMLFEPNSSRLRASDLELLNFVGHGIKSIQDQAAIIRIDGHTAAIPENPDYEVSDRILSSERANTILMYFEDTIGIDPSKLVQIGFGKQRPIASNEAEETRQQNRRVEIFISGVDVVGAEMDTIYEKLAEE